MSEYWVSNEKKYCRYCNTYYNTDKTSLGRHENGNRHKFNVRRFLQLQEREQKREQRKEQDVAAQLREIERAADAQYQQDMQYGTGHAAQHQQFDAFTPQPPPQGDNSDLREFYASQGMLGAGGGDVPPPSAPAAAEEESMSTAEAMGTSEAMSTAEAMGTAAVMGAAAAAVPPHVLPPAPVTEEGEGATPTEVGGVAMSEKMQMIFQKAAAAAQAAAAAALGGAPPPVGMPALPGMPPLPGMPMPPGMPPLPPGMPPLMPGMPGLATAEGAGEEYGAPAKTEEEIAEEEQKRIWAEEDAAWERRKKRQALERVREEWREKGSAGGAPHDDDELEARFGARDRQGYDVEEEEGEEEGERRAARPPPKKRKEEDLDLSTPYGQWKASAPVVVEDTGGNPYGTWETVEAPPEPEPEPQPEPEQQPEPETGSSSVPLPVGATATAVTPYPASDTPVTAAAAVPAAGEEADPNDLNTMFKELDKDEYDGSGPAKLEDLLEERPAVASFKKRGRKRKAERKMGNARKRITLQQIEEDNFSPA